MRAYAMMMVAGCIILLSSYANADTLSSSEWGLYLVSAVGGLMLFGGAFGFALALFFSLWHGQYL